MPNFDTSILRDMMSDEASHSSGTSPVSGKVCHWVPAMVLLEVMCTYCASGSRSTSSAGIRVKFASSDDAATRARPRMLASLIAFLLQVPVCR